MGGLQELQSDQEIQSFLQNNAYAVVTFSAHWCGPCRQSKPALEELAIKSAAEYHVPIAIVYEDHIDVTAYNVRAFPTYVLYFRQKEHNRVQGANIPNVEQMITSVQQEAASATAFSGTGSALGGGGGSAASAAEARAARLAKLGGGGTAGGGTPSKGVAAAAKEQEEPTPMEQDDDDNDPKKDEAEDSKPAAKDDADAMDVDDKKEEEAPAAKGDETNTEVSAPAADPTANLDQEALQTLTQEMGFTLLRAQKGLLYGNGATVESAVEWLMQHQDDEDIDEPISSAGDTSNLKAQSYKCNDCGKILSNMANLELHANKTGHSDFEESTQHVKPLTAEEKAAKIAEIKELLKAKRSEREAVEKSEEVDREKQRRFMGQEMAKTREQLEKEQRKREVALRKKEKEDFKRERARLRAELAKDKAERQANKGKLSTKLGVDGYNPDGIQYDVDDGTDAGAATGHQKKKLKADASKIDDYIQKVSSYKAGGDGGKCLKVLKAYVSNVVDKPDQDKFKTINMENKAYVAKVKPFVGAKALLLAVGFAPPEGGGGGSHSLVLSPDADMALLAETKTKLEKALAAYG